MVASVAAAASIIVIVSEPNLLPTPPLRLLLSPSYPFCNAGRCRKIGMGIAIPVSLFIWSPDSEPVMYSVKMEVLLLKDVHR